MADATTPPPAPPSDGLTDEERQAAIAWAVTKKNAEAEAAAAVERAAEEARRAEAAAKKKADAEAKDRKANPIKWVGTWLEGDVTVYYPNASPDNDRRIVISGQGYEHTHEDADGVWIYRRM